MAYGFWLQILGSGIPPLIKPMRLDQICDRSHVEQQRLELLVAQVERSDVPLLLMVVGWLVGWLGGDQNISPLPKVTFLPPPTSMYCPW